MTRLNGRSQPGCAHRSGFTYIELLVCIALIVIIISILLPTRTRCGEGSGRVKCASNLRQIGQAILLYSNDNRGAYPRTRASSLADGAPDPIPVWATGAAATQPFAPDGPAENDVTAALFLLLRTQDITSEVFTCPQSDQEKDTYGRTDGTGMPIQRSNFTDVKKNLSYSYQNPYPSSKAIGAGFKLNNAIGAEFAVAADKNPGTAGGESDNVLFPTATSSAKDMKRANTANHDRDGQNILYGDGHVAWESNPFVGVNRDNIWTTADGKINASPVDANDSVLLPTDD
jgi:prepilin-type N-terminal cleavage/methylation domain-containing protein/prepilin-type processing-associated H-X9-DG protein